MNIEIYGFKADPAERGLEPIEGYILEINGKPIEWFADPHRAWHASLLLRSMWELRQRSVRRVARHMAGFAIVENGTAPNEFYTIVGPKGAIVGYGLSPAEAHSLFVEFTQPHTKPEYRMGLV